MRFAPGVNLERGLRPRGTGLHFRRFATFARRAARLPLNRPRYTEASETGIQLWKLEKLQA